ncbi:MAG TPA: NAD(P)-binding domain-containing protein [Streptosporangiaceae bacterium]
MTTAIIGTGRIGSAIARRLASGGETLRLSSADNKSAQALAAQIRPTAVVAVYNHDALQGADAVVFALRFTVLKSVIEQIADSLAGKISYPSRVHTGMHFAERCRPGRAQPAAQNGQIRATQPRSSTSL